jgi:adenine-specific DNA-methyltransferase
LLADDGVIFISIDDNEVGNLKKICNDVFGEQNFIAELVWERAYSPKNDARYISNSHDYVLMFAKSICSFQIGRLERTEEANARYNNPDNDPRGVWKPSDMSVKTYSAESDYPITLPSGRVIEPPTGRCWRLSKKAFFESLTDSRIYFGADGNSVPQIKRFLAELKFEGMAPQSIMFYKDVGHSQEGTKEVTALLKAGAFDGPKPIRLLRRLLTLANLNDDAIILDFFSGSATTAHAVMQLNAEDGGKRKFIMVQLPELTDENSEAYKAGYKNICEIGKERIRRAGQKILAEWTEKNAEAEVDSLFSKSEIAGQTRNDGNAYRNEKTPPDIGFRVLKLDSSNMKEVFYTPQEYAQVQFSFDGLVDNIKDDRSAEDLLFQVMLDLGIPLSSSIDAREIGGKTVYFVNDGYLIACFESVNDEIVTAIAQETPYYAVFRDNSFDSDDTLVNYEQIFKTHSPTTQRRVL